MLRKGADTAAAVDRAGRKRRRQGGPHVHADAFHGFAAKLDAKQRRDLLADPNVVAVVPDEIVAADAQTMPTGHLARRRPAIDAWPAINSVDDRVDADVAIVDTASPRTRTSTSPAATTARRRDRTAWRDKNDHGTHVAGTVGAIDNGIGVVGVAPGARVWGVQILNDDGYGLLSWYVCGLDWIPPSATRSTRPGRCSRRST